MLARMTRLCISGAAALGLFATTFPAAACTGQQYAGDAKIDIAKARAIALKARPGKITDEELEKEKGGSGLRYSFDVQHNRVTYEVGVDAKTGKILENKKEGLHPD